MLIALLLAQATATSPPPTRFSVLVDPCANASNDGGNDVVVCGRPETLTPRLPLPQFRGPPDHAAPSNPELRPSVALDGAGVGAECGGYGENCPVGGGGYVIPKLLGGAAGLVKSAFAKHPDKRGRVAIDLREPAPDKGKVLP